MGGPPVPAPPPALALELYKLEYERAAIRYEDIYKAIWQIFSYLTVISGALLTFGSAKLQENLFLSLVCLPLLFWYVATYYPLNRYGDICLDRLVDIEQVVRAYGANLLHYTEFRRRRSEGIRVRYLVNGFFFVLLLIFLWNSAGAFSAWCTGASMVRQPASEVKIVTVNPDELKALIQSAEACNKTPQKQDNPKQK